MADTSQLIGNDGQRNARIQYWIEGIDSDVTVCKQPQAQEGLDFPDAESLTQTVCCNECLLDMQVRNSHLSSLLHSANVMIYQLQAQAAESREAITSATRLKDQAVAEAAMLKNSLNEMVLELQAVHRDRGVAWDTVRAVTTWESQCAEGQEKAYIRRLVAEGGRKDILITYLQNLLSKSH